MHSRLLAPALCLALLAASAPWWLSALPTNTGYLRLLHGDPAGAAAWAERGVGWQEGSAGAYRLWGLSLARTGEPAAAAERLERAVSLDPGNLEAHYQLAEALYSLGQEDAAVEHWRAAKAGSLLRGRGEAAKTAIDLEAAGRWYALSIRVAPSDAANWLGLAQALAQQGWYTRAADAYGEMVERFPSSRSGYEGRANLLYNQLKDKPAGRALLERGLALVTNGKQGLYHLRSTFQAAEGDLAGAEADANRVIALEPANGWYLSWLGDLYLRQKRYDEAIAQYETTAQQASDRTWLWRGRQKIGALYAGLKDWPAAIAEYQQAVDLSREQGAKPDVLAANYVQLGNQLSAAKVLEEAIGAYQTALALDPTNRDAARLLQDALKPKK